MIKLVEIAITLIKIQVLLVFLAEMIPTVALDSVSFGTAVAFFYQLLEKIIILAI